MGQKLIFITSSALIWIVALFGINSTYRLASKEFSTGDICPKIIGIPVCYIILTCLIFILISQSQLLNEKNRLYFIGAGVAALFASIGSFAQLMGWLECPKTEGGIPMCFLSLGMFSSLLVLKFIEVRSSSIKSL